MLMKANKIATGHNADDIAETVLLNILRNDIPRLGRCANIITGEDSPLPRAKPFKYTYEKEIVMYAYYKNLDYFSTECTYAPFAARGYAREYIKISNLSNNFDQEAGYRIDAGWVVVVHFVKQIIAELESVRPAAILDLITSVEVLEFDEQVMEAGPILSTCTQCGYISS